MTAATRLPLTISEQAFQNTVIEAAYYYRWLVFHARPAQVGGRWMTATQGHVGYPDLTLARADSAPLHVELKRHGGRVTSGQTRWLRELGMYGRLWTPEDWNSGVIVAALRDGAVA